MARHDRGSNRLDGGFTLIEMMVVLSLAGLLMTLGALALRQYWFAQALIGSRDEIVNELRGSQERAVSESNPQVQGVLLREGSSSWAAVEYDPNRPAGIPECIVLSENTLLSKTVIATATFSAVPTVTAACDRDIPSSSPDDFAFFFARGSATNGTVTLTHPERSESWTITVTPITGRVGVD